MTINEQIAVMQAFAAGKPIQYKQYGEWKDTATPIWNWFEFEYRIKPDSLPEAGDVIWLIDKDNKLLHIVYSVDELNRLVTVYRQLDCYDDPITRTIKLDNNWLPYKK